MTACNCTNPSPNCPCRRHYDYTPIYPAWWWYRPVRIVPDPLRVTLKITVRGTPRPHPNIPALPCPPRPIRKKRAVGRALRPEDV